MGLKLYCSSSREQHFHLTVIVNASSTIGETVPFWKLGFSLWIFFCSSLNTVISLNPVNTDATVSLVYTSCIITFAFSNSSKKKNSSRCWQIDMNSWHQGRLETEMQSVQTWFEMLTVINFSDVFIHWKCLRGINLISLYMCVLGSEPMLLPRSDRNATWATGKCSLICYDY